MISTDRLLSVFVEVADTLVDDFDFVDFSQGIPLADAGEAAALEAAPQLKQMLADLKQNP